LQQITRVRLARICCQAALVFEKMQKSHKVLPHKKLSAKSHSNFFVGALTAHWSCLEIEDNSRYDEDKAHKGAKKQRNTESHNIVWSNSGPVADCPNKAAAIGPARAPSGKKG
jgi:hypothetical protein